MGVCLSVRHHESQNNCLLGASALQWHLSPNRPQAEPWISRPPTPESILRPLSHLPHPVIKSSAFSRCLMQTHRKASPSLPFSSISHQPPKYIPFSPLLLISEHACPKPGHSPPPPSFDLFCRSLSSLVSSLLTHLLASPLVPAQCTLPSTTAKVISFNHELEHTRFLFKTPGWLSLALKKIQTSG